MASGVIAGLLQSHESIEQELGTALQQWQSTKVQDGRPPNLGREPGQIIRLGAVQVITSRVLNEARGFDEVPAEYSYESIVARHPDRFDAEVVALARQRLKDEEDISGPTHEPDEYERRVAVLRNRKLAKMPAGLADPARVEVITHAYLRDPSVKAFVLNMAGGRCELCREDAPFIDCNGHPFLEVHHVKSLANHGRDFVSNTVALCPNCHRAVHHSNRKDELEENLYQRISRLVRE